jgi:hypothetical protein
MEVALILGSFISSALALDCLYKERVRAAGALIIINLCLTVAIAYQFKQIKNIFYVLMVVAGVIIFVFAIKYYLKRRKSNAIVIDDNKENTENENN